MFLSSRCFLRGLFSHTELRVSSLIVRACAWSCIGFIHVFMLFFSDLGCHRHRRRRSGVGGVVWADVYTIFIRKTSRKECLYPIFLKRRAPCGTQPQSVSSLYYALRRSGKSKNFYMRVFGIMKPRLVGWIGRSAGGLRSVGGRFLSRVAGLRFSGGGGGRSSF